MSSFCLHVCFFKKNRWQAVSRAVMTLFEERPPGTGFR